MPGLGRHVHFDEASRGYPVRDAIRALRIAVVRKKTIWSLPNNFPLNQGDYPECVAFGSSGELAANPVVIPGVDNAFARDLYPKIQLEDRLMGNNWPEGASVLAGAKACQKAGHVETYRWAFGIDDVIDTLVSVGPVVIGIPWYSSMGRTTVDGLVTVSGQVEGGHCVVLTGYWPAHPAFGDVVVFENSWGADYGVNGRAYIKVADLARLLAEDGDACVLVDVAPTPPAPPPPPPRPPQPQPSTWWQWLLHWLGW